MIKIEHEVAETTLVDDRDGPAVMVMQISQPESDPDDDSDDDVQDDDNERLETIRQIEEEEDREARDGSRGDDDELTNEEADR